MLGSSVKKISGPRSIRAALLTATAMIKPKITVSGVTIAV